MPLYVHITCYTTRFKPGNLCVCMYSLPVNFVSYFIFLILFLFLIYISGVAKNPFILYEAEESGGSEKEETQEVFTEENKDFTEENKPGDLKNPGNELVDTSDDYDGFNVRSGDDSYLDDEVSECKSLSGEAGENLGEKPKANAGNKAGGSNTKEKAKGSHAKKTGWRRWFCKDS